MRKVPPELLERAKELRKNQTPSEQILWECLRDRRLGGAKFRRQHNIGSYIVDFYCHDARLVVEVDGPIHDRQQERDENRDRWLMQQGLQVVRFKNEEVQESLDQVLNRILDYLNPAQKPQQTSLFPTLLPSPVGEGPGVRPNLRCLSVDADGEMS
ncbi:endonuclease domain-containing protein (plasmid) [Synechocystis sp. B12]|nr:endonuclease domain-containing protein [Synechocystis sp. B12]